jgi:hypothetical protein
MRYLCSRELFRSESRVGSAAAAGGDPCHLSRIISLQIARARERGVMTPRAKRTRRECPLRLRDNYCFDLAGNYPSIGRR